MTLSLIGNLLCEVRSLFFGLFGVRAVSGCQIGSMPRPQMTLSLRYNTFAVSLFRLLFVPDLDIHDPRLLAKSCIKQAKVPVTMVAGAFIFSYRAGLLKQISVICLYKAMCWIESRDQEES